MLQSLHFLLTYACTYECDHCFLYCGPNATGTFTIAQIRTVLHEAAAIGTVRSVYFEGGEAFLFHPILVEGLRLARSAGFRTGLVTNCYWATSVEDATLWLAPLREAGIDDLRLSDDDFHSGMQQDRPARLAARAAEELGLPSNAIAIERPSVDSSTCTDRGEAVVGGSVLFKGRAVATLTPELPTRPASELTACTHEELVAPRRVHLDALGHVHICQGVSMGNMWQTPLSQLDREYDASSHPICGPLVDGGPAALARHYGLTLDDEFVDECHCCYVVRSRLRERFPELLAPPLVYGVEPSSEPSR
jgi:hypothetical protein